MKINADFFKKFFDDVKVMIYRFPVTVVMSVLVSVLCIINIHTDWDYEYLIRLTVVVSLGLPLFTCIGLINEKYFEKWQIRVVLYSVGFIFQALYLIFLSDLDVQVNAIRFFIVTMLLYVAIFFVSFLYKEDQQKFEIYAVELFLNFCKTFFFSAIFYLGLCLAILAIDLLLGVDVEEKIYLDLFFFIIGFYSVPMFLKEVPRKDETFEKETYPKALSFLITYIFLPLVTIYLGILYVYIIKIIVLLNLPEGNVTMLVLSFSGLGIFSLFLIAPIERQKKNRWIMLFSRSFYYALIPLTLMLYVAIGKRVYDYGITESRYYICLAAFWQTLIIVYFVVSKRKNKIIIPLLISLLLVLSIVGPWNTFFVSKMSQKAQLTKILKKYDLIDEKGKLKVAVKPMEHDDWVSVNSKFYYFEGLHGLSYLDFFTAFELEKSYYDLEQKYFKVNTNYEYDQTYFNFRVQKQLLELHDYDYFLDSDLFFEKNELEVYEDIVVEKQGSVISVKKGETEIYTTDMQEHFDFDALIDKGDVDFLSGSELMYAFEDDYIKLRFNYTSISFNTEFPDSEPSFYFYLFFSFK